MRMRSTPPIDPARAEAPIRGEALLRALERPFLWAERSLAAVLPARLNPLQHLGAIANTLLVVAVLTGALLLFWYSPSVHSAHASMRAIEGAFLPRLVRSLHRYSSDACVLFVALHGLRLFAARRFTGARWLAWITGLVATALLWLVGWLGYWLVWDEAARQVALGTARALDVLPIFGDPLSRSFLTDASVNSLLFFIVFFFHMLVPIGMAVVLWLHIARLQRPDYFSFGTLGRLVCALLVVVSVALPATAAGPAHMTAIPGALAIDGWYLAPLWLTDRVAGGGLWALCCVTAMLVLPLPWLVKQRAPRVAAITTARCNACEQCATDCPYEAIQLVPRTDGRPFPTQAQVDPSRCVGCGICVGSCSTAGTSLPGFDMLEQRSAVESALAAASEKPSVVFACSEGATQEFPGALVVRVPCAGWVQAVSVERALRHGAKEVVVAGCTGCRFREGLAWTEARVLADRRVTISSSIDRARVRVIEAGALRPPRPIARRALQLAAVAAFTLALAAGSMLPYAPPQPKEPELIVAVKQTGATLQECRDLGPEELAKLPPHMRQPRVCERRRAPVKVIVQVDGAEQLAATYAPQGLWGDGTSVGFERLAIGEGEHEVEISVDDGKAPYTDARRLRFGSTERHVLLFDRTTGFHWE